MTGRFGLVGIAFLVGQRAHGELAWPALAVFAVLLIMSAYLDRLDVRSRQ